MYMILYGCCDEHHATVQDMPSLENAQDFGYLQACAIQSNYDVSGYYWAEKLGYSPDQLAKLVNPETTLDNDSEISYEMLVAMVQKQGETVQ